MILQEKELHVPAINEDHNGLLEYISQVIIDRLPKGEIPVRFVVTKTDNHGYYCELGVLTDKVNMQVTPVC